MKRNFTKHMIAAVSAAMLTMSLSAGVMAAEAPNPDTQPPAGIEQQVPAPQDNGEAPAQNMQQMPPKEAPQEGEKPAGEKPTGEMPTGEKPAGEKPTGEEPAGEKPTGEMPTGEKPAGEKPTGEEPAGEKPADENSAEVKPAEKPSQGGQQLPPAQMGQEPAKEMKDNGVENTLKAVEALDDSDQKTNLQNLLDAYKAAVEAVDKTTDNASRKTALEAMDAAREALNKALTEAGVDSQISAVEKNAEVKPAEKPAQGGTTAVAPAAESTKTAQNATDKENMNLFQKFLQWLKGFGKKN